MPEKINGYTCRIVKKPMQVDNYRRKFPAVRVLEVSAPRRPDDPSLELLFGVGFYVEDGFIRLVECNYGYTTNGKARRWRSSGSPGWAGKGEIDWSLRGWLAGQIGASWHNEGREASDEDVNRLAAMIERACGVEPLPDRASRLELFAECSTERKQGENGVSWRYVWPRNSRFGPVADNAEAYAQLCAQVLHEIPGAVCGPMIDGEPRFRIAGPDGANYFCHGWTRRWFAPAEWCDERGCTYPVPVVVAA